MLEIWMLDTVAVYGCAQLHTIQLIHNGIKVAEL